MMPIVQEVRGQPVLVAGDTPGAREKARIAASFGARVEVVRGPYDDSGFEARVREAALLFVDTGDEALDARIAALARAARTPVNVVDRPHLCTFIMPAYVRGERYALAITTFGRSPMASRLLRERLEGELSDVDGFVRLQIELRARLAGLTLAERAERLHRAGTDAEVLDALRRGDHAHAHRRAHDLIGVPA